MISNPAHTSKFYTIGYDDIADFDVSMEWWTFYSTTKFQNINNYYKILLTVLQNHQCKETNLSLMSPEAFHFDNYIWLYRKHDVAIALLSKKIICSSL